MLSRVTPRHVCRPLVSAAFVRLCQPPSPRARAPDLQSQGVTSLAQGRGWSLHPGLQPGLSSAGPFSRAYGTASLRRYGLGSVALQPDLRPDLQSEQEQQQGSSSSQFVGGEGGRSAASGGAGEGVTMGGGESNSAMELEAARVLAAAGVNAPQEPGPEDCCQTGCVRCVWDVYDDATEAYEEKRELVARSLRGGGP